MYRLFKTGLTPDLTVNTSDLVGDDEDSLRIRCPRCHWQPGRDSVWCCDGSRSPEGTFRGCGTLWNTFATLGRCPGCRHQWRWTSCLRCGAWSRHEDWYETSSRH